MRKQSDLIDRLKEYRVKRHISHGALAKKLGINSNTLGQWLEGHRKLRPNECQKLEDFLKPK
jgi:transcriptional regulator with XRE-family HTH domain